MTFVQCKYYIACHIIIKQVISKFSDIYYGQDLRSFVVNGIPSIFSNSELTKYMVGSSNLESKKLKWQGEHQFEIFKLDKLIRDAFGI